MSVVPLHDTELWYCLDFLGVLDRFVIGSVASSSQFNEVMRKLGLRTRATYMGDIDMTARQLHTEIHERLQSAECPVCQKRPLQ